MSITSESVTASAVAQETPAVDLERTPEQLFADHVAYVAEHGDVHEYIPPGLKPRIVGYVGAASLSFIFGTTIDQDLKSVGSLGIYPMLAFGAYIGGSTLVRAEKNSSHLLESFDPHAQEGIGERYDLYRTKNDEIILHWRGTVEEIDETPKTVDQSLRYIAELAQDNGIEHVLLDAPLVQDITGADTQKVSLKQWLDAERGGKRNRKIADIDIVPLSTSALFGLAERARTQEPEILLQQHIEALRAFDPANMVVKTYDTYRADTSLLKDKLQLRLRDVLNTMNLEGDSAVPKTIERFKDRGIDSSTALHGDTVYTFTPDSFSSQGLAQSLDMTSDAVARILANPLANPQQYKKMLYMLLYQETRGSDTIHIRKNQSSGNHVLFAGDMQAPWSNNRRRLLRAMGAGVTAAAIAGGLVSGLMLDWREDTIARAATNAQSHALAITHDNEIAEQARQSVLDDHIGSGIYDAYANKLVDINGWLASHSIGEESSTSTRTKHSGIGDGVQSDNLLSAQSTISEVGNIPTNAKNVPAWFIHEHGMDSNGYWATGVSSYYENDEDGGIWVRDVSADTVLHLPAVPPEGLQNYIQVTRPILAWDYEVSANYDIPVLQGTRPIAISVDGYAVQTLQSENGTYTVAGDFSWQNDSTLSYWLVKDDTAKPRAVQYLETIDQDGNFYDTKAVNTAWAMALGEQELTDEARTQLEVDYIRNNFMYKFAPVDSAQLSQRIREYPQAQQIGGYIGSIADYELLVGKRANCNVANTLVALDNPQLNAVIGYRNSNLGHGPSMLSTAEAHLWLTNAEGDIIDATPSRIDTSETGTQDLLSEQGILDRMNQTSDVTSSQDIAIGGIALVVGGLATIFAGTRIQRYRRRRAAKLFSTIDAEHLALTTASVEQVLYAAQFDVQNAQVRARNYAQKPEQTSLKLQQPAYHSKDVQKRVAKHIEDPAALRSIKRTLRLARRGYATKVKK